MPGTDDQPAYTPIPENFSETLRARERERELADIERRAERKAKLWMVALMLKVFASGMALWFAYALGELAGRAACGLP